jgi:flagellar hook-associated protein 3 FlgL
MSGQLNSIYNNISFALNLHMSALAKLQEQVSTGSTINRTSDDPTTAYQILGLNSQTKSLGNYIDNISNLSDILQASSTSIEAMSSSILEAKTIISQASSGTYDEQTRQRTAQQINDILEQLVLLANSKRLNQYIFSGSNSQVAPYAVERTDGKITSVNYQGGSEDRNIEIAPGVQSNIFYVGDELFRSNSPQTPQFQNVTGVKAGTGTSNIQGDVWMTVINDGTNYKISIDDGLSYTTVPSGGLTNQAVTDSRTGRVLYADTTGINSTGTELVRVPGSYDIFNTLISIRDILQNDRGITGSQLQQLCRDAMETIDEAGNLLTQANVTIGARISFLDDFKNNLTEIKNNADDETSRLDEADIAQLAIDITKHQILYQMTLSMAAQMLSKSLLDYIQTV